MLLCLFLYPFILWVALLIAPCWGGGLLGMIPRLAAAMQAPTKIQWTEQSAPSIFVCTGIYVLGLAVYFSSRRRTRDGEEHGSATWGSAREVNRQFAQKRSKILTRHVRLGLDSRQHKRSLNVLVIGGSGAAKTRSYVLPNILEANTNYVITDPKSEVLLATGGYLKSKGYEIRVLNLVNLGESDGYNPFCYLRDEKDALKLVNNLIQATTPKGAQSRQSVCDPVHPRRKARDGSKIRPYEAPCHPANQSWRRCALYPPFHPGSAGQASVCAHEPPEKGAILNKHNFNDKKAKRLYLLFATTAMLIMVFCTAVFAETDPLAVVNNLSTFIFSLICAIGLILLGFGILQIGLALKSHDASQRANGILTVAGGIVITFTKEILTLITGG